MAHEQLKPFKKGVDPRRNVTGAQRKTITTLLKEMGENKSVSYNIVITDKDGVRKEIKGTISGKGKNGTVNQLIAVQLLSKALKGDLRAIQEVLDRTEGKPKQAIETSIVSDKTFDDFMDGIKNVADGSHSEISE